MVGVGIAGGAAAVSVATVGSGNVISACYRVAVGAGTLPDASGPNLRVIDPGAGQTCSTDPANPTEHPIQWNITGPPGIQGPPGPPGRGTTNYSINLVPPLVKSKAPPAGKSTIGTGRDAIAFDLLSYSFAGNIGGGGGKGGVHEVSITKLLDKNSVKLLQAADSGDHFKSARLVITKKGGGNLPYLEIDLTGVEVAGVQLGSGGGGDKLLVETVTLKFANSTSKYYK